MRARPETNKELKKGLKLMLNALKSNERAIGKPYKNRTHWLKKSIGISGMNQTQGAIRTLEYLIKNARWD